MTDYFLEINTLQCRLKAAHAQLESFRSGDAYRELQELRKADQRSYSRRITELEAEVSQAHAETVSVRNQWFDVFEDVEKEHQKELSLLEKRVSAMEQRALKAERERDEALGQAAEWRRRYYETASALEESEEKNAKLHAQLNRSYENSSLPSSQTPNHKKIMNGRERTGRRPGGQPGHIGHGRKRQEPTKPVVMLPPPEKAVQDPNFKKTGRTIVKQVIGLRVLVDVEEYQADVYYNSKTGERLHAAFPDGVNDDVNYDSSIRAFLFLLNNYCNVSIDKCRAFLSDITGGSVNISKGMINSLSRSFAKRSEQKLKKIFAEMLSSPVMHTDCTGARADAKTCQVFVCTTSDGKTLYFAREHKGFEGIKGTAVEDYQGILVHDHDRTFYHYGSGHQECLAHVLRYLKGSMENEPERQWNRQMYQLLREMIHYRNSLPDGMEMSKSQIAAYEKRYKEILAEAKQEYEDVPAGNYYREGFNLYLKMEKYMADHLLFLHDLRVPTTNNAAERKLRPIKRKQAQATTFRSFQSIESLCASLSMLELIKLEEGNLFSRVSELFEKKKPMTIC